jgi:hypothetical protein
MSNTFWGYEEGVGSPSELQGSSEPGMSGEQRGAPARAGGRGRGNAANLSHEARVKGGQRSAQVQVRDEHGQFAGRAGGESRQQRRSGDEPGESSPNR